MIHIRIARKFGEFGKLSVIFQPKYVVVTIINPLADLFIRQTFCCQMLEKSKFAKLSLHQTFPLYNKLQEYILQTTLSYIL